MAESFTELAIPASQRRQITRLWRHLGCQCLADQWAEPWTDESGAWHTYHLLNCPVATTDLA